jgi:hypothetical protein
VIGAHPAPPASYGAGQPPTAEQDGNNGKYPTSGMHGFYGRPLEANNNSHPSAPIPPPPPLPLAAPTSAHPLPSGLPPLSTPTYQYPNSARGAQPQYSSGGMPLPPPPPQLPGGAPTVPQSVSAMTSSMAGLSLSRPVCSPTPPPTTLAMGPPTPVPQQYVSSAAYSFASQNYGPLTPTSSTSTATSGFTRAGIGMPPPPPSAGYSAVGQPPLMPPSSSSTGYGTSAPYIAATHNNSTASYRNGSAVDNNLGNGVATNAVGRRSASPRVDRAGSASPATLPPTTNTPKSGGRVNPNDVPRPPPPETDVMYHTYTTPSRKLPPICDTGFLAVDTGGIIGTLTVVSSLCCCFLSGISSPRYMRATTVAPACSSALFKQANVPLAIIATPFAKPENGELPVPLVDLRVNVNSNSSADVRGRKHAFSNAALQTPSSAVTEAPVRCSRCRGYVCPFVRWMDGGDKWKCHLCGIVNDTPDW